MRITTINLSPVTILAKKLAMVTKPLKASHLTAT